MEAFSMLRYWRDGGGRETTSATTIATTAPPPVEETKKSTASEDEGPFFDLEVAMPDEEEEIDEGDEDDAEEEVEAGEDEEETIDMNEFNFTVSSSGSGLPDPNLSPAEDLFFKGHLIPLESSSLVFNAEQNSKSSQFPVSLLKSATKFRVFFLRFKKPKAQESNDGSQKQQSKFFTVKFKVEEVPLVSLFTRESSRGASSRHQKLGKEVSDDGVSNLPSEKDARRPKDVVQKYLKMIKPLYVRVSKRYGDKLRFSGQLSLETGKGIPEGDRGEEIGGGGEMEAIMSPANQKNNQSQNQKQGSLPASLRLVRKHLGKSRLASSTVPLPQSVHVQRRDDSLLQQQDGIQGAIAHCKMSFNATKGSSVCYRDASDEVAGLSISSEEGKEIPT